MRKSGPGFRWGGPPGPRVALERDGAPTRLHRFEAATDDVSRRVRQAIGAVETVLAQAGQLEPEEG